MRTLARCDTLTLGSVQNVFFAVWTERAPRVEDVQDCVLAALAEAISPSGIALIVALHPRTPLPEDRVRVAIQRDMRRLDQHLRCGVTVIERDGFVGSSMRAVAATMQLLARPTHPEKIVCTGAEAASFVCGELARQRIRAPSEQAVVEAYQSLTAEVWAAPALATQGGG